MKKQALSSYTLLFIITILVGVSSYFIPSGSFDYQNNQNQQLYKKNSVSIKEISEHQLTPILGTYHYTENIAASLTDILSAPLIGAATVAEFIVFVLGLGVFLQMLKELKILEILLSFMLKYRVSVIPASLIILFMISILSSITGLRDENIMFLSLLVPFFTFYGLSHTTASILILCATTVGVGSAMLNPTIVGILAVLSGNNIASGILVRLAIFCFLFLLACWVLYHQIKKEPHLNITIEQDTITINRFKVLGIACLIVSFSVLVYCLVNQYHLLEAEAYFLLFTLLGGYFFGKKEYELIQIIKKGMQEILPVTINISVARGILYLLDKTQIKDTLLYWGSELLGAHLPIWLFSLFLIILIFSLYLLINSTSAVASISFPLLFPIMTPYSLSYQYFVIWFLIATAYSQILNPSGFLITQMSQHNNFSYSLWIKSSLPLMVGLIVIWLVSLTFFYY